MTDKKSQVKKCCLCDGQIGEHPAAAGLPGGWNEGHNASPVKRGRCCDVCNDTIVIPARLRNIGNDTRTIT